MFLRIFFPGSPAIVSNLYLLLGKPALQVLLEGVLDYFALGVLLGCCHPRKFCYVFFLGCPSSCSQFLAVVLETCVTGASGGGVRLFGVGRPFGLLPS